MRFWEDNRRLLELVLGALVLFAAVRLFVIGHYNGEIEAARKEHESLQDKLAPGHSQDGEAIRSAMGRYGQRIKDLDGQLGSLKGQLQIKFPDWTTVPSERNPAEYFRASHAELRRDLSRLCTGRVNLEDPDLGFELRRTLDKKAAQENLRRLSIVDALVRLLVDAKVHTIEKVEHSEHKLTGASVREENPRYVPRGKFSFNRDRFFWRQYPPFIREYSVRLALITDIDSLMKFLHLVRQENKFLMIRTLTVSSAAGRPDVDGEPLGPGKLRVAISAAGMSFLSEEEVAKIEKELEKTRKKKTGGKTPTTPRRPPTEPMGA